METRIRSNINRASSFLSPFLLILTRSVSWDWLQGKDIDVIYQGSVNSAQVVITYAYFEVEYRQKQVRTTDDVSAYVVGSIESRPDAVVQYLLTEKANVPTDKLGSVWRSIPIWYDVEIWYDVVLQLTSPNG
ncbi:unnamed protein product, partial [marine sediment metagenome]